MPRLLIMALGLAASLWGAASTAQTLVLVSIDGFRWDYLDWPEATNMQAIAARGFASHKAAHRISLKDLSRGTCRSPRGCIRQSMV
jgi:hypothetical protein